MSLLMGISFALFYTLFGLPLGRLTDSSSRLEQLPIYRSMRGTYASCSPIPGANHRCLN